MALKAHGIAKEFAKKTAGFRILTCIHGFYNIITFFFSFNFFIVCSTDKWNNTIYPERGAAKLLEFADLPRLSLLGRTCSGFWSATKREIYYSCLFADFKSKVSDKISEDSLA